MRIAVILPSLKRAAPIVVAQDIVASLVARGCEVDVYYFKEENDTISFACPSFKVNLLKPNDFVSYDIVHSHMLKPDFYLWLNRRRIKAQIVSTLHNEIDLVLKDYYGRIISWLVTPLWLTFLKSMDKVICLSQVAKNTLTIKHNIESSTFIYNGRSAIILEVDHNDEVELLRLKEKYFVLGVIANLSKIKGIDQIIRALPSLTDHFLVVIGDGPEYENLVELAKNLHVLERCSFLGYKKEAHNYLEHFDAFMMTSFSEGFPLSVIEAAQFGVPIVCSNLPIFQEFFDENEVAFFELGDSLSLINAVRLLQGNTELMSNRIRRKYMNNYTSAIMGNNYYNLFKSLCNE